jgi:putative two-component system protein, hydrogenase maturation factor HypX/HoxX
LQPIEVAHRSFRMPAVLALGALADSVPLLEDDPGAAGVVARDGEIQYEERGAVGYLHFNFYNGALNAEQCERLCAALASARRRPTRVIVLMGGPDFWCNGMHLHCIEAAESPADASWANINAINDLALGILTTDSHLTIAALQGNAAAGGVFLALATDYVLARSGIVLNPHYRNMGNLFGSEYWTYLLPRRIGAEQAHLVMSRRLPLGAEEARTLGLIDGHAGPDLRSFYTLIEAQAASIATDDGFTKTLTAKRARRERDEQMRPLVDYRTSELDRMHLNFYGFDPSYHIARHRLVHHTPHGWPPLHLARHRRLAVRAERETVPA